MRLALFEPDIPQNTGTILRLAACMGIAVDIIEPCGFPFSERSLRRAGMDYLDQVELKRHSSFEAFDFWRSEKSYRLILLSTKADRVFTEFEFETSDILMMGRESVGVPAEVFSATDEQLVIPMADGQRAPVRRMARQGIGDAPQPPVRGNGKMQRLRVETTELVGNDRHQACFRTVR